MREFDAFPCYPPVKRIANRTITNRIAASYKDKEFYDGNRQNGYGGMYNDLRWAPIAENLIKVYGLTPDSSVLQVNCHKGFLLQELLQRNINIRGITDSQYAYDLANWRVQPFMRVGKFTVLPFQDNEFDLVVAVSTVYSLSLVDAISSLKEIQRVGKKAFITLASYDTPEEYWLGQKWYLRATTILTKPEWIEVLNHCGYEGDYTFETVQTLGLGS